MERVTTAEQFASAIKKIMKAKEINAHQVALRTNNEVFPHTVGAFLNNKNATTLTKVMQMASVVGAIIYIEHDDIGVNEVKTDRDSLMQDLGKEFRENTKKILALVNANDFGSIEVLQLNKRNEELLNIMQAL